MKCPKCNAWSIVKATRNQVTRRRECANGHRFTTKELCIDDELYKEKVKRMQHAFSFQKRNLKKDENNDTQERNNVPTGQEIPPKA